MPGQEVDPADLREQGSPPGAEARTASISSSSMRTPLILTCSHAGWQCGLLIVHCTIAELIGRRGRESVRETRPRSPLYSTWPHSVRRVLSRTPWPHLLVLAPQDLYRAIWPPAPHVTCKCSSAAIRPASILLLSCHAQPVPYSMKAVPCPAQHTRPVGEAVEGAHLLSQRPLHQ